MKNKKASFPKGNEEDTIVGTLKCDLVAMESLSLGFETKVTEKVLNVVDIF